MDSVTREIRQVLLGNVVTEGKYLTVSSGRLDGLRYGVTDGADTVVLRGVMRHTKYFQSNLAKGKIKDIAHKAMMDIGRKVVLKSNPDAEAILCRYMATKPLVLLFEVDDIGIKVQTYTARSLSGLISEAWIRRRLMKKLPDELTPVNKEIVKTKLKEADEADKQEEKAKKEEKKLQKAEEKKRKAEEKAQKNQAKGEKDLEKQKLKEAKKRAKIEKKLAKLGATATWAEEDPLAGETIPDDEVLDEAVVETTDEVAEAAEEVAENAETENEAEEAVQDVFFGDASDEEESEEEYEPEEDSDEEESYEETDSDDDSEDEESDDDSEDDDSEDDEDDGNAGGYASQNDLPMSARARNFNEKTKKKGLFGKKRK